jgi:hypothetical protein
MVLFCKARLLACQYHSANPLHSFITDTTKSQLPKHTLAGLLTRTFIILHRRNIQTIRTNAARTHTHTHLLRSPRLLQYLWAKNFKLFNTPSVLYTCFVKLPADVPKKNETCCSVGHLHVTMDCYCVGICCCWILTQNHSYFT